MYKTVLYHRAFPKGKEFDDRQELDQAKKEGWVEAPWLINQPEIKPAFTPVEKPDKNLKKKRRSRAK